MEKVILVDTRDNQIGVMEKLAAHVEGRLHRAVSVFIFNTSGQLLLQRRAAGKYHSPLLWTNTCCGHPRPGEEAEEAAARRLSEEMGLFCTLHPVYTFTYKAPVGNDLTEYEYDHVYAGVTDDIPAPAPDEAAEWKYISETELMQSLADTPDAYTAWFRLCIADKGNLLFNTVQHEGV